MVDENTYFNLKTFFFYFFVDLECHFVFLHLTLKFDRSMQTNQPLGKDVIHLNNITYNNSAQPRHKSDHLLPTPSQVENTHLASPFDGNINKSRSLHEPLITTSIRSDEQYHLNEHHTKQPTFTASERLNFEMTINEVKHRETWNKRNNWLGSKIDARGVSKWIICFCIGVFTGCCMFVVCICIDALVGTNLKWAQDGLKQSFFQGFIRFLGLNCLFALISGSMVSFIAPSAAGSGIPDVKGWLNGSAIPGLFTMKTLLAKLVGIVFSVSAKFIIGKEGPMVHAGSAFASGIALGGPGSFNVKHRKAYSFRNDADRRDLISCGAAAGVAAAFGAPIGGMLFALEEVASFWSPNLTWRVFFTAAVSNLTLTVLLGCYDGECGTASKATLIDFGRSHSKVLGWYNWKECFFFIAMGAIGGLIGAAFNQINVQICLLRKKYVHTRVLRLSEVLLMAIITTTLLMATPLLLPCKKIPSWDKGTLDTFAPSMTPNTTCFDVATGVSGRYTCDDGYYNPLSSLLLQSSEDVIKGLFMFDSKCWDDVTLWLAAFIYFVLAVTTYGVSIPSGLFIPLILIGSNVGHAFGSHWNTWFNDDFDVGTYALIGASAVLGGSTRMTISLTAIILEITNDIYFLMPIQMTIMVSKWVGDQLNSALYDAHVLLKDIQYLEPKISSFVPSYICAEDIMRPFVTTLPSVIDLKSLLHILNDSTNHHQAFPVMDMRKKSVRWLASYGWNQQEGNYIGMILRNHIYIMLHRQCYSELNDPIFKHHAPPILKLCDLTDRTWKKIKRISPDDFGVSPSELAQRYIDLTPYMFLSPAAVHRNTSVLQLYNQFRGIGLRHLVVIGNTRQIVGMITTHELNEQNLEHAVHRVHSHFEGKTESEQDELFEQRMSFLKGYAKELTTTGNQWLLEEHDTPNAHGRTININADMSMPIVVSDDDRKMDMSLDQSIHDSPLDTQPDVVDEDIEDAQAIDSEPPVSDD
eukprot:592144_1